MICPRMTGGAPSSAATYRYHIWAGGSAARCLFGSGGQVAPCHGLTDGINPVIGGAKDSLLVIGKAGCINHINIGAANEFQNELHEP